MDQEEIVAVAEMEAQRRVVPARAELVDEQRSCRRSFILQDGWACSYKLVPDGGRQVIDFLIPGDFIGLRGLFLRNADRSFAAVTDLVVSEVSWQQMTATFQRLPRLGAAILWAAARDEATMVEHLINIGRRSGLIRTAHLLLELRQRLELVGRATPTGFACPLNQYLLADALGLTAIHLNRVLRQLREQRLVTFRAARVVFHDLARLQELAGFCGDYLDQGDSLQE
jgi:CRP-like cAMP-binding protein